MPKYISCGEMHFRRLGGRRESRRRFGMKEMKNNGVFPRFCKRMLIFSELFLHGHEKCLHVISQRIVRKMGNRSQMVNEYLQIAFCCEKDCTNVCFCRVVFCRFVGSFGFF